MTRQDDHLHAVRESKRIIIWLDGMPMVVGAEELHLLLRRVLEADSLDPIEVTIRVEPRLQVPGSWRMAEPASWERE